MLENSKYGRFSLGNLGYSSVRCAKQPFYMEEVILHCAHGTIGRIFPEGKDTGIGINPTGKTACQAIPKFENTVCSQFLKLDAIKKTFAKCVGKESCRMKISVDAVSHQANSKYFNLPVDPKAHTADMKKCLYK